MHKAPHQTMCQICASGFFQIHWGQDSCDVCPENHYCPVSNLHTLPNNTRKNLCASEEVPAYVR